MSFKGVIIRLNLGNVVINNNNIFLEKSDGCKIGYTVYTVYGIRYTVWLRVGCKDMMKPFGYLENDLNNWGPQLPVIQGPYYMDHIVTACIFLWNAFEPLASYFWL